MARKGAWGLKIPKRVALAWLSGFAIQEKIEDPAIGNLQNDIV